MRRSILFCCHGGGRNLSKVIRKFGKLLIAKHHFLANFSPLIMTAFRTFQRPQNGSLTVIVPEEFRNTLCEVIVLPNEQTQPAPPSSEAKILAAFTKTAAFPQIELGEADVYEQ